jgi:hypothetical protein
LLDHDKDIFEESPAGKVCYEDKVAELFKRPEVENELQGIAAVFERMDEEIERVSKKIDRSPVLTISADGTVRDGDKYGPQKFSVGLVGVGGWGNWDHTFNARWSRLEGLRGNPAGTQWKIASEASTVWLKNSWLSPEGITVAAGLAAEFYKNIPGALHDSIVKAGLQIVYPLADGVFLPLSVTWANHKDLLSEESIVRGHIGLSIDFSGLRKKKEKGE